MRSTECHLLDEFGEDLLFGGGEGDAIGVVGRNPIEQCQNRLGFRRSTLLRQPLGKRFIGFSDGFDVGFLAVLRQLSDSVAN